MPLTREDVSTGYLTMLRRAPESEAVIESYIRNTPNIHAFYRALCNSDEFFMRSTSPGLLHSLTMDDIALLNSFSAPERRAVPGSIVDFVGSVTNCRFVAALKNAGGTVEGIPRPANFHSKSGEWIGSLRSVAEAKDKFVMAELGAGWGPWLAACGVAARRRGIVDIALIAVEGDAGHFGFLQQHLRTNGFDPAGQELHQGIIAARKQVSLFPIVASPASNYGQTPLSFADSGAMTAFFDDNRHLARADYTEVPVFTPAEVFAGHGRIDLVHLDIQGGEADLLEGAMADFSRWVRRIVVGTHSRTIEERLHTAFGGTEWRLEHDDPCRMAIVAGRPQLAYDGTQVWVNPRVAAP